VGEWGNRKWQTIRQKRGKKRKTEVFIKKTMGKRVVLNERLGVRRMVKKKKALTSEEKSGGGKKRGKTNSKEGEKVRR